MVPIDPTLYGGIITRTAQSIITVNPSYTNSIIGPCWYSTTIPAASNLPCTGSNVDGGGDAFMRQAQATTMIAGASYVENLSRTRSRWLTPLGLDRAR